MERTHTVAKTVKNFGDIRYRVVFEGVGVGAASGLLVVLFRLVLERVEALLSHVLAFAGTHAWFIPLWFVILLLAAGATALLLRWEPMIAGSGIPQVDGELQGYFTQKWWRVILAKFAGGILTIGSGLSLGREGPSIQLGAMAGKGFARVIGRTKTEERLLMTCGASAGLAAAFNAPLAGVLFALEEVHKSFSVEVLLSSMASSIVADFISRNVFGLAPLFDFSGAIAIPMSHFWIVMLMGALVGLLGVAYNFCIGKAQDLYERIPERYLRTAVPFLLAGVLAFTLPVVLGGGSKLILQVAGGLPLRLLLIVLVVKFFFSVFSFSAGVPGGIFLPLLVLGSLCGGVFHGVFAAFGMELNLGALVILGMVSCFAAIVRAPVTGIVLITEMTGNFSHLVFLSLAALTAYVVADLLRSRPIYDQLLRRMVLRHGSPQFQSVSGEKLLIETRVQLGSSLCGKRISEINLPERCLIISVKREESEIVPRGGTVLRANDHLVTLCDENDSSSVQYALEKQCKNLEFSQVQ